MQYSRVSVRKFHFSDWRTLRCSELYTFLANCPLLRRRSIHSAAHTRNKLTVTSHNHGHFQHSVADCHHRILHSILEFSKFPLSSMSVHLYLKALSRQAPVSTDGYVPQHFRRHAMSTLSVHKPINFTHGWHWWQYTGPAWQQRYANTEAQCEWTPNTWGSRDL